jgi:uncharacterized protein GlcG (DUF336 family)
MKSIYYSIVSIFLTSLVLNSCQNASNSEKNKDETVKEINNKDQSKVVLAIDSNAINVVKRNNTDYKVTKEETPATAEEISQMVSSEKSATLNEYQKVVQQFFKACGEKDYNVAASLLAYNGKDVKRKNKDHYDMRVPNEIQIVKSTVAVVYGFLQESKNYEFITFDEKSSVNGTFGMMEVSFFKKGLGINRRQFAVTDTPKGMLIVDMR